MTDRRLTSMRGRPWKGDIDTNTEPTSLDEDIKERARRVEIHLRNAEEKKPLFTRKGINNENSI